MPVAATRSDDGPGGWARFWPLLLPGAYLVHLAEEIWGGQGFVRWAAAHLSAAFSQQDFLLINATAWPLMFFATLAAVLRPALRWVIVTVAAILLINGALHLGATVVTRTYSPGLVSGVLLYLPLGLLAVRRVGRDLRKTTHPLPLHGASDRAFRAMAGACLRRPTSAQPTRRSVEIENLYSS